MQGNPPTASHTSSLLVWLGPIALFVTAIGGIIIGWFGRKRSGERRAEIKKHESEALNQSAEALLHTAEARDVDVRLIVDVMKSLAETQKHVAFLDEQLRHRGTMENIARNQKHEAFNEVQRQLHVIRAREETASQVLAEIDNLLTSGSLESAAVVALKGMRKLLRFDRFKARTYKELVGEDPLPLPPAIGLDSGEFKRP